MSNKLSKITNLVMLKLVTLSLFTAFLTTTVIINSAHAVEDQWTFAKFNRYSCADPLYGTNGTYWAEATVTYPSRSDYTASCSNGHSSNASGSVITASQTLRAATAMTVGLISKRIDAVRTARLRKEKGLTLTSLSLASDLSRGEIGLAAGGHAKKGVGVWVQGRYADIEDDNVTTAFDGDITTAMFGIDKTFKNGKVLVGIAAGFESQDFTTTFNKGTLEGDGIMITPYASVTLGKGFSVDVAGGMADMDYDTSRKDPATGELIKGTTDGDRLFASGSVNFNKLFKKKKGTLRIGLNAGMNYSKEEKDAYIEDWQASTTTTEVGKSKTYVTQAKFGAEAGFMYKRIEPFVNVAGEWDVSKSSVLTVGSAQTAPADDDFGIKAGGGVNLILGQKASATISAETVIGREDYKETSGSARLRVDF